MTNNNVPQRGSLYRIHMLNPPPEKEHLQYSPATPLLDHLLLLMMLIVSRGDKAEVEIFCERHLWQVTTENYACPKCQDSV